MQGAGNGMQGGMQKLIDYRPEMVKPRDGGMGIIDRGSNLIKGMIGAPNYKDQSLNSGVMSLPGLNNNTIIPNNTKMADSGTHPLMPMFMDIQNQTGGVFESFEEFLDGYFNQSMLS